LVTPARHVPERYMERHSSAGTSDNLPASHAA